MNNFIEKKLKEFEEFYNEGGELQEKDYVYFFRTALQEAYSAGLKWDAIGLGKENRAIRQAIRDEARTQAFQEAIEIGEELKEIEMIAYTDEKPEGIDEELERRKIKNEAIETYQKVIIQKIKEGE